MVSPWKMVRTQWYNDVSPSWMVHSPGNSVGVVITQPRVEVRIASTLGIYIIRCSYSVRVAISRRRYLQQDIKEDDINTKSHGDCCRLRLFLGGR